MLKGNKKKNSCFGVEEEATATEITKARGKCETKCKKTPTCFGYQWMKGPEVKGQKPERNCTLYDISSYNRT